MLELTYDELLSRLEPGDCIVLVTKKKQYNLLVSKVDHDERLIVGYTENKKPLAFRESSFSQVATFVGYGARFYLGWP